MVHFHRGACCTGGWGGVELGTYWVQLSGVYVAHGVLVWCTYIGVHVSVGVVHFHRGACCTGGGGGGGVMWS